MTIHCFALKARVFLSLTPGFSPVIKDRVEAWKPFQTVSPCPLQGKSFVLNRLSLLRRRVNR